MPRNDWTTKQVDFQRAIDALGRMAERMEDMQTRERRADEAKLRQVLIALAKEADDASD